MKKIKQKTNPKRKTSKKKSGGSHRHYFKRTVLWFKNQNWWKKIGLILIASIVLFFVTLYAMSVWYRLKHRNEPLVIGATFSAPYASHFDLDPKETLSAMITDLNIKDFRLMSYWSSIEPNRGTYDFSDLDWQFDMIEKNGGTVSLALGLRQPRWPECHTPQWAKGQSMEAIYPEIESYIGAVVERYKDRPSLQSYQLENEYFLDVFGECQDHTRERLVKEYSHVKSIDPKTPMIVSLSNNYLGVPIGEPRPDQFGVSVYKRVFDETVTKRYFEYPFTPWWYGGRAGWTELMTGRDSMLHELQAEPWAPMPLKEASIKEQDKSMDAKRLKGRIKYGKATGFRDIYLWGGEWWYWRKVKFNDPSLWNVVKEDLKEQRQ